MYVWCWPGHRWCLLCWHRWLRPSVVLNFYCLLLARFIIYHYSLLLNERWGRKVTFQEGGRRLTSSSALGHNKQLLTIKREQFVFVNRVRSFYCKNIAEWWGSSDAILNATFFSLSSLGGVESLLHFFYVAVRYIKVFLFFSLYICVCVRNFITVHHCSPIHTRTCLFTLVWSHPISTDRLYLHISF